MNQKILITGGAGYIGSKLVARLLDKKHAVFVIDNLSSGKKENLQRNAVFFQEDIRSKKIGDIIHTITPDMIVHLAALKNVNDSVSNPTGFADVNIIGSLNLLQSAHESHVNRFIFASTAGVYGDTFSDGLQSEDQTEKPSSPYAITKLAIEKYLQYFNATSPFQSTILRFANVYGPGGSSDMESVIDIFVKKLVDNQSITIFGDGNQTRDFIYIDDIVDFITLLCEQNVKKEKNNDILNIATGEKTAILAVVKLIAKKLNAHPTIQYRSDIFSGQKESVLDPRKVKALFNWQTNVSIEEGINRSIAAVKK